MNDAEIKQLIYYEFSYDFYCLARIIDVYQFDEQVHSSYYIVLKYLKEQRIRNREHGAIIYPI